MISGYRRFSLRAFFSRMDQIRRFNLSTTPDSLHHARLRKNCKPLCRAPSRDGPPWTISQFIRTRFQAAVLVSGPVFCIRHYFLHYNNQSYDIQTRWHRCLRQIFRPFFSARKSQLSKLSILEAMSAYSTSTASMFCWSHTRLLDEGSLKAEALQAIRPSSRV